MHWNPTGLAPIAQLQNLAALSLENCDRITDAGLAHVVALKQLTSLTLRGCFTDAGLAHLAAAKQVYTRGLLSLSLKSYTPCSIHTMQYTHPCCMHGGG